MAWGRKQPYHIYKGEKKTDNTYKTCTKADPQQKLWQTYKQIWKTYKKIYNTLKKWIQKPVYILYGFFVLLYFSPFFFISRFVLLLFLGVDAAMRPWDDRTCVGCCSPDRFQDSRAPGGRCNSPRTAILVGFTFWYTRYSGLYNGPYRPGQPMSDLFPLIDLYRFYIPDRPSGLLGDDTWTTHIAI